MMKNNPFYLKIFLPLAIQMFADGDEGNHLENHPPQGNGVNGQGATTILETEEAKQLRELKAQFEQSQKEAAREKLINQALSISTEKRLPSKLVAFFVGEDAEKTTANLGVFEAEFNEAVQAEVDKRFKDGGTPHHHKKEGAQQH
ncbi:MULTISPECIES: DUF4355 domain-containing protein [unclassified Lysinibacillus]|uniref:DUF4355 domain-containing protein n=1 Tax=unclassified Lysinibacillus TaxID=2636778 RepID=UPI003824C05D